MKASLISMATLMTMFLVICTTAIPINPQGPILLQRSETKTTTSVTTKKSEHKDVKTQNAYSNKSKTSAAASETPGSLVALVFFGAVGAQLL